MQIVFLEIQHRIEFAHVKRYCQRTRRLCCRQLVADGLEELPRRALAPIQRAAGADNRRYVDKGVVGIAVRDAVTVRPVRPDAYAAERKHSGFDRRPVQAIEQRIEVDPRLDVRGVLDYEMRHVAPRPRCAATPIKLT